MLKRSWEPIVLDLFKAEGIKPLLRLYRKIEKKMRETPTKKQICLQECENALFIGLRNQEESSTVENQMLVGSIMATKVVTVEMDDSLQTIRDLFRNLRFHHLLVIGEKRLVGIISDRDYLKAVSPYLDTLSETTRDRATLNKRAHQIMSHNLITISKETSVESAAQIMIQKKISCLPITDSDGITLGIVTWKDLLQALLQ